MSKCGQECEVYSRVVGYLRPIKNWNIGKREEFKERKVYSIKKAMKEVNKMPNKDGTGPEGEGPKTGRGRGNC